MNKNLFFLLLVMLLPGVSGCFFEPYREVERYELPVQQRVKSPLLAVEFINLSGSSTAYRSVDPDGRIRDDARFKWALPPGELVPRSLNRCFAGDGSRRLSGTIDTFAETGGEFVCAGTIRCGNRTVRFRCTAPVTDATPAARAAAAARCVEKLAAETAKVL